MTKNFHPQFDLIFDPQFTPTIRDDLFQIFFSKYSSNFVSLAQKLEDAPICWFWGFQIWDPLLVIFHPTYSNHCKLNKKGVLWQFFLLISTFCWLCITVLQKWGHATTALKSRPLELAQQKSSLGHSWERKMFNMKFLSK